ncbi:MAG: hypothetical protein Q7V43_35005 [Myxococcales bacterium]|nr:hypothetical protein [Myxococcales bacterium]
MLRRRAGTLRRRAGWTAGSAAWAPKVRAQPIAPRKVSAARVVVPRARQASASWCAWSAAAVSAARAGNC